jgi:hypothetical protein
MMSNSHPSYYRATLTGQLNQGSTAGATMNGYTGAQATVTVTDAFLATGQNVASGKVIGVQADPTAGVWLAVNAPC